MENYSEFHTTEILYSEHVGSQQTTDVFVPDVQNRLKQQLDLLSKLRMEGVELAWEEKTIGLFW